MTLPCPWKRYIFRCDCVSSPTIFPIVRKDTLKGHMLLAACPFTACVDLFEKYESRYAYLPALLDLTAITIGLS